MPCLRTLLSTPGWFPPCGLELPPSGGLAAPPDKPRKRTVPQPQHRCGTPHTLDSRTIGRQFSCSWVSRSAPAGQAEQEHAPCVVPFKLNLGAKERCDTVPKQPSYPSSQGPSKVRTNLTQLVRGAPACMYAPPPTNRQTCRGQITASVLCFHHNKRKVFCSSSVLYNSSPTLYVIPLAKPSSYLPPFYHRFRGSEDEAVTGD